MAQIGYAAMLEQFHPRDLIGFCEKAESAGFSGVMAADHVQPWTPQQGQAAFVWAFMTAAAERTRGDIGPGVTCPSFRSHPAILAASAAPMSPMYPGRFWLGLGSGEALNEHIVAGYWPEVAERINRMFESIEIIRKLFTGKDVKHTGEHYQKGCKQAGKDPSTMPRILQLHLSWAHTDDEAMRNAMTEWPNGGMKFPKADIRSPNDSAQMAKLVRPEDFEGRLLISADPDAHCREIQKFIDLGFDRVYLHNVGRNQLEWIDVSAKQVLPKLH